MNVKLVSTLVVAPLFALSASAFAAEPMQLTSAQMDSVNAGFDASAFSAADALTGLAGGIAATATYAGALVQVLGQMSFGETSFNYVMSQSASSSASSVTKATGVAPPPAP